MYEYVIVIKIRTLELGELGRASLGVVGGGQEGGTAGTT